MIKTNISPILTTRHYGVNDFEIEEKIFEIKYSKISPKIFNNQNICFDEMKSFSTNLLSTEFDNHSKKFNNFAKEIIIKKDCQKPLGIVFDENKSICENLRIVIEEEVNAQVILKFLSTDIISHIQTIEIYLKNNSQLKIAEMFCFENNSKNFVSINVKCETKSQLDLFLFDFGEQIASQKVNIDLLGQLSKANLNSVYFGQNKNRLRLNYIANIKNKKCECKINSCGVLNDFVKKDFVGTISFDCGSSKSIGEENENCILLSNNVKSSSTPILLSKEEDVDGRHSSSTGSIDGNELFYLQTRGIDRLDAIKFLIKAKLNKMIELLFDEDLKEKILMEIDKKIDEKK